MTVASRYSAKVTLRLQVNGQTLALSHVGRNVFIVKDECSAIPPCDATLTITVDDSEEVVDVFLPDGVPGPRRRVQFI